MARLGCRLEKAALGVLKPIKENARLLNGHRTFDRATKLALILLAPASQSAPANAAEDHAWRVLMRIEPDTRLEQVCDLAAMNHIARTAQFRPDRAKSNITVAPVHTGDTMTASGGAFRSKGKWYALSFRCAGNADHTKVLSLTFQVGAEIPKKRWNDLALWP